MDPKLEIRKLPPSIVRELGLILDYADSWKRLMSIIPKQLSSSTYVADIKPDNLPKYNSEHFKIIELAGMQHKRSCTEILIDEWGTSGKIRANLGHLKYLLTKAELFRAADYVAKLLNEEPPVRPQSGPAAPISIPSPEAEHDNKKLKEIEEQLNAVNYPEKAIKEIKRRSGEPKSPIKIIPQIVVSEVDNQNKTSFNTPLIVERSRSNVTPDISALMDDTPVHSAVATEVPNLSIFMPEKVEDNAEEHSNCSDNMPHLSDLLITDPHNSNFSSTDTESSQSFTPAFSQILSNSSSSSQENPIPSISQLLSNVDHPQTISDQEIPALSILGDVECKSNSDVIPNFDLLNQKEIHSSISIQIPEPDSKNSPSNSNKCPSPLPNLSLNTELPHFTYYELEHATNNFSDTPFTTVNENGRFLGKGAFGSVFLAPKLWEQPVAVKKIFLDDVEVVNEDDEVTKQFKNEVEFLCKYKHENLVTLLGYSCDGCTYCLVYEYVPGGALSDTLERNPLKLSWQQRLRIALGTARGVAYLHTAFSTPLIHRDIKSANILLDANNNPKICDFGIVKLLPNQKTDNYTTPFGTSAYMSPECFEGDISIKLDCFSFGVVLLELLTSLPPIDQDREGVDLFTYVENNCEESIEPLLDKRIGDWKKNDVNFAEKVYNLTVKCLDYKENRPDMVQVVNEIEQMVKLFN
ncbi:uncharacterized protein LOC143190027 isoform X1 [Rhynchophorus ferrugineus]|uniref:uncharacterized protein LOC143190027 isoform X1 n=1 Tax=Rhynchophorus ferrugineus TaxID=354439 RepID=UPI003FCDFB37